MTSKIRVACVAMTLLGLLASGISPFDRTTWWLEIAPILVALPILLGSAGRFPLTPMLCVLLAAHGLILDLGGHYTYARVPLGFWMQEWFGWVRNDYDKIGHFAQGFVPALLARELFLRLTPLRRGAWLFAIVTLVCLGISALYELIEWAAAIAGGAAADAFLGTQGDPWDTQSDMLMALIGALVAQTGLAGWHDRQLGALTAAPEVA